MKDFVTFVIARVFSGRRDRKTAILAASLLIGIAGGCGKEEQDLPSPPAPAAEFHILIEAESSETMIAPMVRSEQDEASAGECVRIPFLGGEKNTQRATGKIQLTIDVPEGGFAKLWFRTLWNGACANSFSIDVAGLPPQTIGDDGTYFRWEWRDLKPVQLVKGKNIITVNQREDDVAIDQILVTTDLEYIPVGIEE